MKNWNGEHKLPYPVTGTSCFVSRDGSFAIIAGSMSHSSLNGSDLFEIYFVLR